MVIRQITLKDKGKTIFASNSPTPSPSLEIVKM